jgi:hypothetical protein
MPPPPVPPFDDVPSQQTNLSSLAGRHQLKGTSQEINQFV